MSDIVERLREAAANLSEIYPDYAEAADEITRLRADLAAVTEERDRMREALRPFSDAASKDDYIDDVEIAETDTARKITFGDLRRARAALEGVTKPASPWRDIESAPKDKEILIAGKMDDGTDYQEVCKYFDAANCWPIVLMDGYLAPTHWMHLQDPPR